MIDITACSILICNSFTLTDPHVRVAGRREDVKVAKDKVMEVLDTRVIIFPFFDCICL
jgi:hypothetical protein